MKKNLSSNGMRFLGLVILSYAVTAWLSPVTVTAALQIALSLLARILPMLVVVFVLMTLLNKYSSSEMIMKYVGRSSGRQRWAAAIIGGIISTGPAYLWYSLLQELLQKGMSKGVVAAFLYARAVKPFLLPLMIYYFGWQYTIVLTIVMICFTFLQGFLIEKTMDK